MHFDALMLLRCNSQPLEFPKRETNLSQPPRQHKQRDAGLCLFLSTQISMIALLSPHHLFHKPLKIPVVTIRARPRPSPTPTFQYTAYLPPTAGRCDTTYV